MMARGVGVGMAVGVSSLASVAAPFSLSSMSCHSPDGNVLHSLKYRSQHLPTGLCPNFLPPTQRSCRISSLAPSSLYSPSISSSFFSSLPSSAGCLQLGFSILVRYGLRGPQRQERRCGIARGMAAGIEKDLETWIKKTNSSEPIVVWSKSYCPYCMRVKNLLNKLGYEYESIELDTTGRPELQDVLERVSGQYTVPNVYIGGKHIGGCDALVALSPILSAGCAAAYHCLLDEDTVALQMRGELEPLLDAAGANKK